MIVAQRICRGFSRVIVSVSHRSFKDLEALQSERDTLGEMIWCYTKGKAVLQYQKSGYIR